MKSILKISLYLFILPIYCVFLLKQPCIGQDLIALPTGEKVEVKILSISKKSIKFYNWEEQYGEIHKVSKKFIRWYRPESWTKKRVSFSFSLGVVPYGTSTSLKNIMKDKGYSGSVPNWFDGSIKYPKSNVKIPWVLEIEYVFKSRNGFSIAYANINTGSVKGLYPAHEVFYQNPQIVLFYKFYSKSYRSNFQAGFLMNFCSIYVDKSNYMTGISRTEESKNNLGLMIGYAGSVLEKNSFFLRFQSQFKYVPPIKFTSNDGIFIDEKVGLSSLYLGIQLGFKLYPNKT